jgi:hypothetical protein
MGVVAQNNIFRNLNKDGKLTFYASKFWSNLNVKFFWLVGTRDLRSNFDIKKMKKKQDWNWTHKMELFGPY